MECIIQVFPDEFHLRNLESVLSACSQLQSTVNVKSILVSLIDRLANYAMNGENKIPEEIQVFSIFSTQIARVVEVDLLFAF
jgi:vacuolar protein sorting-associated protein 35